MYDMFSDLSKLRGNFEGADVNPFLWDTPSPLYAAQTHYDKISNILLISPKKELCK